MKIHTVTNYIKDSQEKLVNHPIYDKYTNIDDLKFLWKTTFLRFGIFTMLLKGHR